MTPEEIAANEAATAAAEEVSPEIAAELEKEKTRKQRTEKEKAEFSLRKNAERLKELGGDPTLVLGERQVDDTENDVPEWYRKERAKEAQKTSLQLADDIKDESERNLVKEYLQNRIIPSGNPQDDFRFALGAVHSFKNKQILEEINRKNPPRVTAAGGSAPAPVEEEFTPTEMEMIMMRPPYNLSKEKIIAARKREADRQ